MILKFKLSPESVYKSMTWFMIAGLFLMLRAVKMSTILGAHFSFFSLSDVGMPLVGSLGFGYALAAVALRCAWRICLLQGGYSVIMHHLPGLCASYYWATHEKFSSRIFATIVPLLCIILFVAHPVGGAAGVYALYWLLPIGIQLLKSKLSRIPEPVLLAVASTFIAHAVGSVIWLYTVPGMTSADWLSLIPVVAVERSCFAATMVLVYYGVRFGHRAFMSLRGYVAL